MSIKPIRSKFVHDGKTIYEWEQTMEEVRIFIITPEGVRASHLDIKITSNSLQVGLKGNPPFIKESLGGTVIADECTWTLDKSELEITLQKMKKAETWKNALGKVSQLNPLEEEEVKKKLTLERFQQEHPGFDFSSAEFNGSAPDPREFLGGVKYNQ